jgi:arylsulfatase A-like enzyme
MTSTPGKAKIAAEMRQRLSPLEVLAISCWSGLVAGELEVLTRVLYRSFSATNRMYLMTRHFLWLVPLTYLLLFLVMGLLLALATWLWPRRAGWLSPRLIGLCAILPILLVAGPQIYVEAWLVFALGLASCLAPILEHAAVRRPRWLIGSVPVLLAMVLAQAGWIFGGDRLKQWREDGRPLPPPGSPNVLLVVLDTVRADRLSLYGYERGTTPTLERLARRGLRFDGARAAAPWTLASHATLFTGRWPHELDVKWMYPLRGDVPTLAEYLGTRGYATAGFVGNTFYCAYDSGLDRGFTHYQDYILAPFDALRSVYLADVALNTLARLGPAPGSGFPTGPSLPVPGPALRSYTHTARKDAGEVNLEFLDWLSRRREPRRPFFAFLNYADAHTPYILPPGGTYRFGSAPRTPADLWLLLEGWSQVDKRKLSAKALNLARDTYDNCLAYLDQRLGELFDNLERHGILDQTLVVVTADHGEGLGEHELFEHGESLYRTEIHVPLLIVLPERGRFRGIVTEAVSLRDIPATVAELVASGRESPFSGRSLDRLWRDRLPPPVGPAAGDPVLSELAVANPMDPNQGRSPARRGGLISLAEGDLVYIRNTGDGSEELFDQRADPRELSNLLLNPARTDTVRPIVQRFRVRLDQIIARPHPDTK